MLFRNRIVFVVSIVLAAMPVLGQPTPPTPQPVSSPASLTGEITQFNFGAEGERRSFMIGQTLVTIPHAAASLLASFRVGDSVQVNGYGSITYSGFQRIEPVSIINPARGVTITIPAPGSEAAWSGSGRLAQYNYTSRGEIDGFVLDNGVFVKTPPHFSATLNGLTGLGSMVSVTGYAKQTALGVTVVKALTVNGITVHKAPAPAKPKP